MLPSSGDVLREDRHAHSRQDNKGNASRGDSVDFAKLGHEVGYLLPWQGRVVFRSMDFPDRGKLTLQHGPRGCVGQVFGSPRRLTGF